MTSNSIYDSASVQKVDDWKKSMESNFIELRKFHYSSKQIQRKKENKGTEENISTDFMKYDEKKCRVCYGIEEKVDSKFIANNIASAPKDYYLSISRCAQLTADTFGRPVATHIEQQFSKNWPGVTFFSFFK